MRARRCFAAARSSTTSRWVGASCRRSDEPVSGTVSVNFPPDLERVQSRLAMGPVRHERKELRHPDKNTLLAIEFEYITETRGNVQITPDHDQASLAFRLLNASGFGILNTTWPAAAIRTEVLDDLARLIVSEPNRFM